MDKRQNIIKKNLLKTYYNTLNSLVHLEIIGHKEETELIKRLDEFVYLKDTIEQIKETERNLREFKKSHPELLEEYKIYAKSNIKGGFDLSLSFIMWLGHVKNINYKEVETNE